MGNGSTKVAGRKSRFANSTADELALTNSNPIDGYQHLPILSLEKAVESLIPNIEGVMNYVTEAKANCNLNSNFLTCDESAAIYLYTMPKPFFSHLNHALRNRKRHTMKPWFAYLKLFMTALEKLPSLTGIIWRGVCGDVGSDFNDGDVITWWSVNSCSKTIKVIECYIGKEGTVFAIDVRHGKDISEYSAFKEEQEVILMPGIQMRIKSKTLNFDNRLFIVHIEEENQRAPSQVSTSGDAVSGHPIPSSLDLSLIKKVPRKAESLSSSIGYSGPKILASSNEYLLVYGDKHLCRFDKDLKQITLKIDELGWTNEPLDIIWCALVSRFIILMETKTYLLEPITMKSQSIENVRLEKNEKKFVSCACLNDKLYITTIGSDCASYLNYYFLLDFKFIHRWTVMELIKADGLDTDNRQTRANNRYKNNALNSSSMHNDDREIVVIRSNKDKLGLIIKISYNKLYLYVLDLTQQPFQFVKIDLPSSIKQLTTLTQSNEWFVICNDYNNTLIQISLNCEFKTECEGKKTRYGDEVTHIAVFKPSCLAVIRKRELELYTV